MFSTISFKPAFIFMALLLLSFTNVSFGQSNAIKHIWLVSGILQNAVDVAKYNQGRKEIEQLLPDTYKVNKIKPINTLNDWNKALPKIQQQQIEEKAPLVIFYGHANSTPTDVHFHMQGNDLSIRKAGADLNSNKGTIGIIWSAEAGRTAKRLLNGAGHIIIASTELEDKDNEPVFSDILPEMITNVLVDENKDGKVSFFELHKIAKEMTREWYQMKGYIQLEGIILEGSGNGIGSMAPDEADAIPAKQLYFEKK